MNDAPRDVPETTEALAAQRREHRRHPVDVDVSLDGEPTFHAGFAENLSLGGVFIATHALKRVGEQVSFTLFLPDVPHAVRGQGEVRWVREFSTEGDLPPGVGVLFTHLEEGAADAIRDFLSQPPQDSEPSAPPE